MSSHHYTIISSYHHIIISSDHHIIPSYRHPRRKSVSRFWAKSQRKNRNSSLNPSTKSCRDLKTISLGVIFRDGSASDAQKFVAPPKRAIFDFVLTFCSKNFIPKIFWGVEKSNVGNRLKRVLPKFRADRSHPRGVNGRPKF